MKNVIFNSLPALVEALNQELLTVRGWSFLGIENYTSKGTGERANYLINISPNLAETIKRKEAELYNKYGENPYQNAIAELTATFKAKGDEMEAMDVAMLKQLEAQAEAYTQNLSAIIVDELIKDGDCEYWNASEQDIINAMFALNTARKNPNPNRRRGALNSFEVIGDTGLKYFPETENYALYGLKVNKKSLSPPTNPTKQGARALTRGKDFIRAKYLKGRRQFIIGAGMALVVNKKRFLFIPDELATTVTNTAPTDDSILLGNLQADAEMKVIEGTKPEEIFSI